MESPESEGCGAAVPADGRVNRGGPRLIRDETTTGIPVHLLFRDEPGPAPVRPAVVDPVEDTVTRLTVRGLIDLDDYERKARVRDLTVAFCAGRREPGP